MTTTLESEVDGKAAKITQHDEQPAPPAHEFPEFTVPAAALFALQTKFDDGIFTTSANLSKGKSKMCGATVAVDGVEVKCPHRSVIRGVYISECDSCHRKQTKTTEEFCLGHAALHWGLGQNVKVQMQLGETE